MSLLENLSHTLDTLLNRGKGELGALDREAVSFVDKSLAGVRSDLMSFLEKLKADALRNPGPVFAILRRLRPILVMDKFAVITRFDDVQEVLARDDIFQVTYREKMEAITGDRNFFLGMQTSSDYERDVAHMRCAVRRSDLEGAIIPLVERNAAERVQASGARIDVVQKLTRVVPVRLVAEYFGCVAPSDQDLADWATVMFQFLFTDLDNDPVVRQAALNAATKARAWLDGAIAARKEDPTAKDDVLGRCLAMQSIGLPGMDDVGIRDNLLGLIIGAIPTTSKCCAQALDQLLQRPAELEQAQEAARANDDQLLASYVFEALRFNPNNPGLFRIAAQDYSLAKGTPHGATIPEGTLVMAATQSAMFDDSKVEEPEAFRPGRPAYLDMHFGYGLHTCFGQYINRVQIPGILKPLFLRKNLRRAPGQAGTLRYEGPFPVGLTVTYDG